MNYEKRSDATTVLRFAGVFELTVESNFNTTFITRHENSNACKCWNSIVFLFSPASAAEDIRDSKKRDPSPDLMYWDRF